MAWWYEPATCDRGTIADSTASRVGRLGMLELQSLGSSLRGESQDGPVDLKRP